MLRSICLITSCLFCALCLCPSAGASEGFDDVVLLDNGALIQGRIIPGADPDKVIVEREDGYMVDIPRDRIRLITKDGDPQVDSLLQEMTQSRPQVMPRTGWAHFIRVEFHTGDATEVRGLMAGFDLLVQGSFVISTGIGYETWHDQGKAVPILIEMLGYVWRGQVWPYWYFQIGMLPYFAEAGSNNDPDFMFGWGLGLVRPLGSEHGIGVRVGYRTQSFVESKIGLLALGVELHF